MKTGIMLPDWLKKRAAGVLLHPTSLPGGHGIGCLGRYAYEWVDFLADAGFSYWQMCPVGPTGFGDSPYQVFSSSAGNPYFIDLHPLISKGYLSQNEADGINRFSHNRVDFGYLYKSFFPVLRTAYQNFLQSPQSLEKEYGSFLSFEKRHQDWLEPFAKYQTIKARNHLKPWWEWTNEDKNAPRSALSQSSGTEYKFQVFLQYLFRAQWNQLHQYAKSKQISLIGDLPIYVAPDSSDVWCNRNLFQINQKGNFKAVAGVPPDYFNPEGQLWGNPLYEWEKMRSDGYNWWIKRIEHQLELFEVLRIDHFRAFHDFWSVPEGSSSARLGTWEKGPGLEFWKKIKLAFPQLPFLAEDLGDISKGVRQ
ncbi:MAG: 4-alpha-glucanotransferase, partial [Opitutae bacterium]